MRFSQTDGVNHNQGTSQAMQLGFLRQISYQNYNNYKGRRDPPHYSQGHYNTEIGRFI